MLVAERYRLDALLGRGGMGEVWRATDETLGRAVAVKLLVAVDGDDTAAERFRTEAQIAARLNHPHVVAVYDFGSHEGRFYLVMELVEGWNLAQELAAHGPLPLERLAAVAAQAASGLAAAHRQGVVHRDVKPGNLMLGGDGTVKVADFGIARAVDEAAAGLTRTGHVLGSGNYLAPERALGQAAVPASDVYALGCALYELLVGHPPFRADSLAATVYQHVDALPTPPGRLRPQLPGALEDYLLRLLAKDPNRRPTAEEVSSWFAAPAWLGLKQGPAAAPAPSTARMVTSPGRPPAGRGRDGSMSRRTKALTGVAGATLFGTAAIVGMHLGSGQGATPARQSSHPSPTTSTPTTHRSRTPGTGSAPSATAPAPNPSPTDAPPAGPAKKAAAKKPPKKTAEKP